MSTLPRSTPEAQGVSSQSILDFVNAAEAEIDSVHSLMVVRHGHVIAEGWWHPYGAQIPHEMYSVSKSFTSTAIGLAVAEGLLTVDDRVVDLLPKDAPVEVSENLAKLRVRHLLTMSAGHGLVDSEARGSNENWARAVLSEAIPHEPATHFLYDSGTSYLLSAIITELTGETLLQYLTPRLFEPLGIRDARWDSCPRGISTGGWGLEIRTEDVATLGQLYLQRGAWDGTQLLAESWVADATSDQIANATPDSSPDGSEGYGYQFWRSRHGYRADGVFGQFCIVLPEHDAVIVLTSGVSDNQTELDLVWKHLLPAFSNAPTPEVDDALEQKLASLEITAPTGDATPNADVSGIRFALEPNDSPVTAVSLELEHNGELITLWIGDEPHSFRSSRAEWALGTTAAFGEETSIAAKGAWTSPSTFSTRVVSYETPFRHDLSLTFDGDEVVLDVAKNVELDATPFHLHAVGHRDDS